jgi:hypothetical protein
MIKTLEQYEAQYELINNILNIIDEHKDTNKEFINKIHTLKRVIAKDIQTLRYKEREKDLHTLVETLRDIDNSDLPDEYDYVLNSVTSDYYSILIKNAINKADGALIDDEGHPIWEFHDFLGENGFHVFPGEKDRFGWITGCIQTKKGYIVYG